MINNSNSNSNSNSNINSNSNSKMPIRYLHWTWILPDSPQLATIKHFPLFLAFSASAELPCPMNGDSTIWRWQRSAAMLVCTDEHFYIQPLQAVKAANLPLAPCTASPTALLLHVKAFKGSGWRRSSVMKRCYVFVIVIWSGHLFCLPASIVFYILGF